VLVDVAERESGSVLAVQGRKAGWRESGRRCTRRIGHNQAVANGILLDAVQVDAQKCANKMARKLEWLRRGICG